ncbi:hypothetical protein WJX77_009006 [Trebouxia sp. C0004]
MALNQINFEFGQEFPSSWDFGKDILDGFEQFMDTTPNLDPAVSYGAQRFPTLTTGRQNSDDASDSHAEHSSKGRATDRKQQNNRAAQKRFRQRQKERAQSIEAQLSETTKQLHDLRIRQKQLEARNALLEKVAKLNQQPSHETHEPLSPAGVSGELWDSIQADADRALDGMTKQTERGPVVTFTIDDQDLVMTVQEVGKISSAEFQRLYSLYARKLGACLLEMTDSEGCSTSEDLHRWITELISLMVCVSLGSPKGLKAFHSVSMDGSSASVRQLPDSFYEDLLVTVDLTEAQIQDLLYLRRLFCGKIGQLSRARKELMSELPSDSIGNCHASDKLEEVTNLAEQLRANGSEEYRTYMQFASSFYRGVLTAQQHAMGIVHSYPWIPEKHRLLELLAAKSVGWDGGEPEQGKV